MLYLINDRRRIVGDVVEIMNYKPSKWGDYISQLEYRKVNGAKSLFSGRITRMGNDCTIIALSAYAGITYGDAFGIFDSCSKEVHGRSFRWWRRPPPRWGEVVELAYGKVGLRLLNFSWKISLTEAHEVYGDGIFRTHRHVVAVKDSVMLGDWDCRVWQMERVWDASVGRYRRPDQEAGAGGGYITEESFNGGPQSLEMVWN